MFFFRRPAACALTVTAVTLSCGLAARAQVGVTQPAPVAAVGVKPVGGVAGVVTAPVTDVAPVTATPASGAAAVGGLGGVKASGVNTGLLLLLGQIAEGQMTLEEAWSKGLLDAPKVLQLLSQTQRFTEDTRNETLQRDLAGLLVRLAPQSVATPERLSARVRIALCRYYSSIGDARAVPLCEALIAEKLDGKQINQPVASNPDGGSSSLWLSSVILLAQYYQNVGQWQTAGETWERALKYWQNVDWWQSGVWLDAARAYAHVNTSQGQSKSNFYYAKVQTSNNELFKSIASYDNAGSLLREGKNAEASQLVHQALQSTKEPVNRGILLMVSAQANYAAGNFEQTQASAQAVLDEVAKTKDVDPVIGFDVVGPAAQALLKWSQRWQETPLLCNPKKLVRNLRFPQQEKVWKTRIKIRSFKAVPLTVSCNDSQVKCTLSKEFVNPEPVPLSGLFTEQIVEVEFPYNAEIQTIIYITSSRFPQFRCEVPLKINS